MFRFVFTAAAGISVLAAGCLMPNRVDAADEKIRDWLVARHVVDASLVIMDVTEPQPAIKSRAPGGITVASRGTSAPPGVSFDFSGTSAPERRPYHPKNA